jgi:hypothetical protein
MTHRKNHRNANGHAGPRDRTNGKGDRAAVNGHAPDAAEREEFPVPRDRAASDDAGGLLVASATSSVVAGANPDAYAAAAPAEAHGSRSRKNGAAPRPLRKDSADPGKGKKAPEIPPGTEPLPIDGPEFVEAVHERMDLIALQVKLLRSDDEKIVQRELAYLRELRYGKTVAPSTEDGPVQIIYDVSRSDGGSNVAE